MLWNTQVEVCLFVLEITVKRICLVVLLLCVLAGVLAPRAAAQLQNPTCLVITTWWFNDPIPGGWFIYGEYPGGFVFLIAAENNACAPPVKCHCYKNPPPAEAGHPVELDTGNTYIDGTDVTLPGLGGGLRLQRRWNSIWPASETLYSIGLFGPNWRSTYEEEVFMDPVDHYPRYLRADGSFWAFALDPGRGAFVAASPRIPATTLSFTSTEWVISFQSGEKRHFNATTGLLTEIDDRNGNITQLTYDSSNRLTTVTDPASRHLYFNYASGSSFLVTSVTSDFGVTYSYAYDSSNRLYQVTKPDLTTVTYAYNSQSQITQVTDSDGKVLETHTYDSTGHGLTASQANGVNAITLTYPQ